MAQFRKKPVVIDAIEWRGNVGAILDWLKMFPQTNAFHFELGAVISIDTLEGPHTVQKGDWIIRGVKGEFYACKPDIFELTYEPV